MSIYNVGDHVIVDSHTGAERLVYTISEVLLVDEPIQKGINPLGTGPRLRYRAGSRIIRPEEIHGHAFNRPNNYGGMCEPDEPDPVNHPAHYGGDTTYEAIKVITAWELGFDLGNVTKYVARAGKKDPSKELEDLRKALFYLEHRINQLEQNK